MEMELKDLYDLRYSKTDAIVEARREIADKYLFICLLFQDMTTMSEKNKMLLKEAKDIYLETYINLIKSHKASDATFYLKD